MILIRRRPLAAAAAALTIALTAALVGLAAPPTAGSELPPAGTLPPCPAGPRLPVPLAPQPATRPVPPAPPATGDPTGCRARVTRIEPAGAGRLPVPRPGYHHLGATTVDEWSAVLGRLAVTDPDVDPGSYDFVAARFLAKQPLRDGRFGWLEVGWAETGWSGDGAQRVYTFDSETSSWMFFEEYEVRAGDRIWVYLHADTGAGRPVWQAWLWWGGRWNLLATADLPNGDRARLEQYVEVHQDRRRAGSAPSVPPVRVDGVRVAATGSGPLQVWRRDTVPTVTPVGRGDYCLAWETEYDAWSAGDCTFQE